MFAPCSARNPATAATIPGRSAHEINSRALSRGERLVPRQDVPMRTALISRALRAFRMHGARGVARIAAYRLRRLVVVDEEHIWLALELRARTALNPDDRK